MRTGVRFELWEKAKYEGVFHVEWLLVKDVPNFVLTDIKMSNTPTKKSITSCRDGEEVMFDEVRRGFQRTALEPQLTSAFAGEPLHLGLHAVPESIERLGRL